MRYSAFLLVSLVVSIASAQKVDVFEKASKPEFIPWGKNTVLAQGYGYVVLINGDSLKGPLKVEKDNETVIEVTIKAGKNKQTLAPKDVKSFNFYPYKIFTYDPSLPGNPKFYPGYIITNKGVKVQGKVAIMVVMGSEWKFFPKRIYFIPAKAVMASSMAGGDLLEVGQINKDVVSVFDAFGNGYLQRIVDGRLRLYYNPNPKVINQPLFFNRKNMFDSAQVNAQQREIEENIRSEEPLTVAVRSGKDVSADITQMNTEIIDEAYFLIDVPAGKTFQLNENNFKSTLEPIFNACALYKQDHRENKEELFNYKKIEETIVWFNTICK